MFTKFFALFFLSFITFVSAAKFSVEMPGWTRLEIYAQDQNSKSSYYATGQLVLKPEVHFSNNAKIKTQFEIIPNAIDEFFFTPHRYDSYALEIFKMAVDRSENTVNRPLFPYYRQTGSVIYYRGLYNDQNEQKKNLSSLGLAIRSLYLEYKTQTFESRFGGVIPYHFGMGISHSNPEDSFLYHWFSAYDALDMNFKFSQFYLRPIIQLGHDEAPILFEAGVFGKDWRVSALLEQESKLRPLPLQSTHLIEIFGEYQQDNWGFKASASYNLDKNKEVNKLPEERKNSNNENMLIALETLVEIPHHIPTQLEIKIGRALGEAAFHPNYSVSLIHWNRFMETDMPNQYSLISNGQINQGTYLSTNLNFSLMRNKLKVQPLFLVAIDDENQNFYELNINGSYNQNGNLSFIVKTGIHYDENNKENPHTVALLAQGIFKY